MSGYEDAVSRLDRQQMGLEYYALGLCGEAGEAVEHVKKSIRKDHATELNRHAFALELGDVLWYLTRLANLTGFTLYEIMHLNVRKLEAREAARPRERTSSAPFREAEEVQ